MKVKEILDQGAVEMAAVTSAMSKQGTAALSLSAVSRCIETLVTIAHGAVVQKRQESVTTAAREHSSSTSFGATAPIHSS